MMTMQHTLVPLLKAVELEIVTPEVVAVAWTTCPDWEPVTRTIGAAARALSKPTTTFVGEPVPKVTSKKWSVPRMVAPAPPPELMFAVEASKTSCTRKSLLRNVSRPPGEPVPGEIVKSPPVPAVELPPAMVEAPAFRTGLVLVAF